MELMQTTAAAAAAAERSVPVDELADSVSDRADSVDAVIDEMTDAGGDNVSVDATQTVSHVRNVHFMRIRS